MKLSLWMVQERSSGYGYDNDIGSLSIRTFAVELPQWAIDRFESEHGRGSFRVLKRKGLARLIRFSFTPDRTAKK